MLPDSFWRVICLSRFYSTQEAVRALPPPRRSFSFYCTECHHRIQADSPIFMREGHSYCSERCRALSPETNTSREQLFELETKVRRRVWNASPHGSEDSL